jgi:predicted O-methyltransferase YrrM
VGDLIVEVQMANQALKYIQHYIAGQGRHDAHSPFMYNLITKCIKRKGDTGMCMRIERLKADLKKNPLVIEVVDYGAGTVNGTKPVKQIAKNSAIGRRHGRLLHRLVTYFKPQHILELGTSLGIGTAYLASAYDDAKVLSVEGSPETAALARQNLQKLGIANVEVQVGNFDEVLPAIISAKPRLDFVFFDGNHRKEPTLDYFTQCLAKAHDDTVFVFHDIHWSPGMEHAWEEIKAHPRVRVTVDLFFSGLVFFKPELSKQHYHIRF